MRPSFFVLLPLCGLFSCSYSHKEAPQAPTYEVTFYVENGSESQPAIDLLIKWDAAIVAQDTIRYTRVADVFQTYTLPDTSPGEHHLRVVNKANNLQLDTTILVREQQTHVFLGFSYTKLNAADLDRLRKLDPPGGVDAAVAALSHPPYLGIYIKHGPTTIP